MPKEVQRRHDGGGLQTDVVLRQLDGLMKAGRKDAPCSCQAGFESEIKGLQPDVLDFMKSLPREVIRGIRTRLKRNLTPERMEVFEGLLTTARKPVIDGKIYPHGGRQRFGIMEALDRIFDPNVNWEDKQVAGAIMQRYRSFMGKSPCYVADAEHILHVEAENRLKRVESPSEHRRIQAIIDRNLISDEHYYRLVVLREWFIATKDKTAAPEDIKDAAEYLEKAGLYKDGKPVADAEYRVGAMLKTIPPKYLRRDLITDILDDAGLKLLHHANEKSLGPK